MSSITGCFEGCYITGLVDDNVRADAYTTINDTMNLNLAKRGIAGMKVKRKDSKQAVMTAQYGSKATPKEIFGEGELLEAFYEACFEKAPGAFTLMDVLINAWNPHALAHKWTLPDTYKSVVKVMQTEEIRVEVDELDHHQFTTSYEINKGSERGVSLVAK
jgi:hypothetical protein